MEINLPAVQMRMVYGSAAGLNSRRVSLSPETARLESRSPERRRLSQRRRSSSYRTAGMSTFSKRRRMSVIRSTLCLAPSRWVRLRAAIRVCAAWSAQPI